MPELPKNREQLAEAAQKSRAATIQDIDEKLDAAYSALEGLGDPKDLSGARLDEYRQVKGIISDLEKQRGKYSAKMQSPVVALETGKAPTFFSSKSDNGEQKDMGEIIGTVLDFAEQKGFDDKEILGQARDLLRAGMYNPELAKMQSLDARYAAYAKYFKTLNDFANQYRDLMNNFAPDMATGKENARGYIEKPEVSRGALDELQRRGAVQMEEPEAPSMWNAATQMLIGMVGQAFQNVNQSELSAAESQQVSSVVSANSAAYQAAEFASFKQNRQRVLEINTQLQAKYQDDLIAAMRDYETRADAAQWNYEQQLLTAAMNEQRMYYELAGKADEFDALADKIYGDIGLSWIKDKDRLNEVNAQIKNRAREFNAQRANQIQMWAMNQITQQKALADKLTQDGLQNYAEHFKNSSFISANEGDGATIAINAKNAISVLDMSMLTENGRINNKNMGQLVAANARLYDRIAAMDEYKDNPAAAERAYMKVLSGMDYLATRGVRIRWLNLSDSTFNQLVKGNIQSSFITETSTITGLDKRDYESLADYSEGSRGWRILSGQLKAVPISCLVSGSQRAQIWKQQNEEIKRAIEAQKLD